MADPHYRDALDASHTPPGANTADAIGRAAHSIAGLLGVAALMAYTSSGSSALRMARERPRARIIGMTSNRATARRLSLVWGVRPVLCHNVTNVVEMTEVATNHRSEQQFAKAGEAIVIGAGMPFGASGTTNLLRIEQVV
jgi:pyruvate kinase